jgi:hypothetical protein
VHTATCYAVCISTDAVTSPHFSTSHYAVHCAVCLLYRQRSGSLKQLKLKRKHQRYILYMYTIHTPFVSCTYNMNYNVLLELRFACLHWVFAIMQRSAAVLAKCSHSHCASAHSSDVHGHECLPAAATSCAIVQCRCQGCYVPL